ncbi:alpha-amylase family glycosyl hydrolase [Rubripirellula amarantea]|uniref:Amylosucrase n=1 Tax=Rubripirellula amarantea TaxID=2527999 RepID=A0A5C5WUL2_9BACT|nr:amylosucrase [Rubripirellula amarantea]MDA8745520.1 alpha-amylase family glycosyl hydrolase [Rubripirellula amarantea]TWT53693.1 Amylosucrase [Rubripirellula amarantea]
MTRLTPNETPFDLADGGRTFVSRDAYEADLTLRRLMPHVTECLDALEVDESAQTAFTKRLNEFWPELFALLRGLYGGRYDFYFHLEQILLTAAKASAERPSHLIESDRRRSHDPEWFHSEKIVGGALYVDLFSGNLNKLTDSISYFKELGLTYLHLMPLFAVRPGDSDGGYAISDYRSVDPRLGTIEDLTELAARLHEEGILLVLDFVFNHTSDDHRWAQLAQAGNIEYQDFYYIYPDRTIPDKYQATLREIFPTVRRGSFTWHDASEAWVWTTFNSFQWDLNYSNPAVFRAMAEEMFFIANTGVDILRLDAVAFIWKQMGTSCENLPEAHQLIQAFNRLARIATPGLIFKSEAIVHPEDVLKYVSPEECQISYNPTLMALLWESLATRKTSLLYQSLSRYHKLPPQTAWVNYLRCHDDIGWTFDDADAAHIGINAYEHRQFLNRFYTGQFEGSFARGIPFQENHETGDMRIAGTLASLAGLERAIELQDNREIELSVRRMLLLQSVTLSIGGIPLLYLGEEWGMLNDYEFVQDPAKAGDTRWVHRPKMRWEFLDDLKETLDADDALADRSIRRQIFRALQRMIEKRKHLAAFAGQDIQLYATGNPHLLCFARIHAGSRILVVANFSEHPQQIDGNLLRTAGLARFFENTLSDKQYSTEQPVQLEAYESLWLSRV